MPSCFAANALQCFKSCPREGASDTLGEEGNAGHVSSHAPVRGHPVNASVASIAPSLFQVMPP